MQVVAFLVELVLARLLVPDDYGTVALTAIFFGIANVLVDGGFCVALIQKKDADDLDFNSVFYTNIALSVIAYAVMFFAAPWIASFYKVPMLKEIVRVAAVVFVFNAVNAVQNAELTRKMLFHLSFRVTLITSVVSALCGISLAFMGCGVWTLVWMTLVSGFVGMMARWTIVAWRPKWLFSWKRLGPLFSYGWKMAASAVISTIFTDINSLLMGKFYTRADVAFVNRGWVVPMLTISQVNESLERASFPALASIQDEKAKVREAMRLMMRCSTFLTFPLMVWMALCAPSIIWLLFGEKWLPSVPYLRIFCFTFAIWPLHTMNLNGIKSLGRSDVYLKLEIIKRTLQAVVILGTFRLGVFNWMAISAFVLGPLCVLINAWPNRRLLGYTFGMQLADVTPSAIACLAEAAAIYGVSTLLIGQGTELGAGGVLAVVSLGGRLLLQFVVGFGAYFAISFIFGLRPLRDFVRMAISFANGRFPRLAKCMMVMLPKSRADERE